MGEGRAAGDPAAGRRTGACGAGESTLTGIPVPRVSDSERLAAVALDELLVDVKTRARVPDELSVARREHEQPAVAQHVRHRGERE
ncbi:MAG: hypothetical protein QOJ46_1906 [bacterium]